ncbi:CG15618 [Drosophila busckii]|uniref:tRNA (32-2'-O)-methyltransferase regulator THADA n=2 Tax=Drosophila busckii TaxID=30019 RepID=A0A0M4ETX8_DROBS|nr:CG15618 [Drosophila busckii]
MREALAPVPPNWENSYEEYVMEFAAAMSCEEQMRAVKEIYKNPEAINFLADLVYVCPLKHSVRGVLTRLLSGNGQLKKTVRVGNNAERTTICKLELYPRETIVAALRQSLQILAAGVEQHADHVDYVNDIFASIASSVHNFPVGREALALEIQCFMPLMTVALESYWLHIIATQMELSPTRRNQIYFYIHNLLRFYVNFPAEFRANLSSQLDTDLCKLHEISVCVAKHLDTPWDVRAIAGLTIGHIARFNNQLPQYLENCIMLNGYEDIPIKAAALVVLQKQDYQYFISQALAILRSVLNQLTGSANSNNLLVYMSKHLYTYSKTLSVGELQGRELITYKVILGMLMRFAMEHISSDVESIRHMSANLLQQSLQHAKDAGQTNILSVLYKQFERQRMPLKGACLMLQQLTEVMGVDETLINYPTVQQDLFPNYLGVEDSVNALYKSMMIGAYKEQTFEIWFVQWVVPLALASTSNDSRFVPIDRLTRVAVQQDPRVVVELLQQPDFCFGGKLSAMLMARRCGQQDLIKILMLDYFEQIKEAVMGVDDNVRLLALAFLIETPRSSEPYTEFELESIINYILHNANNPSAHMRQMGHALLQKGIKRLELNLAAQLKEQNPLDEGHMLLVFLNKMLSALALNLFPTANYGRRWMSLRLFGDLIQLVERLQLGWEHRLPPQALPYLENCLRDSYEHNKALAAGLLGKMQRRCELQPELILRMLKSQRPPESLTGAYQLLVLCSAPELVYDLPEQLPQLEMPQLQRRCFAVLNWLKIHMNSGLATATGSLSDAAKQNPIYGLLFASRLLLSKLDLHQLAQEQVWVVYIEQLLICCFQTISCMMPVLGAEAPEGHVPMEPESLDEAAGEEDADDATSLTPQLVLLCAWRSVKEVCLIFGELVQRAPLQQEMDPGSQYLISAQQLADIGEQFLTLLAELKHRGAFEQAYVGFGMLCRRLWLSPTPQLNRLPPEWLDDAMNLISGQTERSVCATRRSAGVPYMLQALICTELKLGTRQTFNRSMDLLLAACEPVYPPTAVASVRRGHALNIMRALFRCSELADLVTEYVGRGVIAALTSLTASEWSERNSGTLLLSSLMVRIFGVERPRDEQGELHVRNRMTGRIFFTRYPLLFDYFYACLKLAAEKPQPTGGQAIQLEALLQLLQRIYPSALEGAESSLNLNKFVPFLVKISAAHDMLTRQRASHVVASFISHGAALKLLRRIMLELEILQLEFSKNPHFEIDLNGLHGNLLMLQQLYRNERWGQPKIIRTMLRGLCQSAIMMLGRDIFIHSMILTVMVDILQNCTALEPPQMAALRLVYNYETPNSVYERCDRYAISPKYFQLFALHVQRMTQTVGNMWSHIMTAMVRPAKLPTPIIKLKLELFLYCMCQQANFSSHTRGLIDSYDIKSFQFDPDVVAYYKALPSKLRTALAKEMRESTPLQRHLLKMLEQCKAQKIRVPGLKGRLYCLLSLVDNVQWDLAQLLELQHQAELEPGLCMCITRVMNKHLAESQLYLPVIHYALQLSDPHQPCFLRYRATQLLDRIFLHIRILLEQADAVILGNLMRLVLMLLVDESELVRNYTAEMISSCLTVYMNLTAEPMPVQFNAPNMMASVAERYFVEQMLSALQQHADDGTFLLTLFEIIVEPFVTTDQLDGRSVLEDNPTDFEEDPEVFDKQNVNLYCEGLRVTAQVAKCFKDAFPQNAELTVTLDAMAALCSYTGFGEQPIAPRVDNPTDM